MLPRINFFKMLPEMLRHIPQILHLVGKRGHWPYSGAERVSCCAVWRLVLWRFVCGGKRQTHSLLFCPENPILFWKFSMKKLPLLVYKEKVKSQLPEHALLKHLIMSVPTAASTDLVNFQKRSLRSMQSVRSEWFSGKEFL